MNSAVITPGNTIQVADTIWLPSKVSNKWPAIILAARRTDRVIGRIMFLIISIITMKGIKGAGVPIGTRWARNSVMLLIILNIINLIQKGRASESVIAKCLVEVKVNENKPSVLLNKITKNNDLKRMMLIFFDLRRVENSLFIEKIILFILILYGEFKAQ